MTRDKEKCASSVLTGVCIKQVDFSENKWSFLWDGRNCPLYTLYIKQVSVERGYTVPEAWKRYHFKVETPCIQGHYRKYLIRGVTSRYLQSGDQLEPISTNSTCIGRVSLLYMNMFKMLELWCPWKAPIKIHAPICLFFHYYKSLGLFTIPVFALVCKFLSLLCMHLVCGQLHCSIICFFLSCVFTMEEIGISVEVNVCFLESNADISGFTCTEM